MVKICVEISENVSFFISCIKFHKIFIESFNEISLMWWSVNNSNSYRLGFWQIDFKAQVVSNIAGNPTTVSIPVTT